MIIDVNLASNPYQVHINENKTLDFNSRVGIITNELVASLHLDDLLTKIKAKSVVCIVIKDGEEYKNASTINLILEKLFLASFDRNDVLLGFGGGVITDITGFVASIFMRGISFFNIPTTLLACVDASVGGKTGINCKFGKNLIGSFYQPKGVYIFTKYLKTLSREEYANGLAEAIKMAVMFDKEFFNKLFLSPSPCEIIANCVKIKASVVVADELENGLRKLLNYGHTFAHVLEKQSHFTLSHGKAVAIGMILANKLSVNLGLMDEKDACKIKDLILFYKLPIKAKIKDSLAFYEEFLLDKKTKASKVCLILASKIGKGEIIFPKKEEILRVLK